MRSIKAKKVHNGILQSLPGILPNAARHSIATTQFSTYPKWQQKHSIPSMHATYTFQMGHSTKENITVLFCSKHHACQSKVPVLKIFMLTKDLPAIAVHRCL